jgi:hypothetical protein
MKEDEMGGACDKCGDKRKADRVLVGTHEGDQLEELIIDGTDKTVTITGNNFQCKMCVWFQELMKCQ